MLFCLAVFFCYSLFMFALNCALHLWGKSSSHDKLLLLLLLSLLLLLLILLLLPHHAHAQCDGGGVCVPQGIASLLTGMQARPLPTWGAVSLNRFFFVPRATTPHRHRFPINRILGEVITSPAPHPLTGHFRGFEINPLFRKADIVREMVMCRKWSDSAVKRQSPTPDLARKLYVKIIKWLRSFQYKSIWLLYRQSFMETQGIATAFRLPAGEESVQSQHLQPC